MTRACLVVVCVLGICDRGLVVAQERGAEGPVIEIDPEGQPSGRRVRGPRFLVWREGERWHLRTHTDRDAGARFSGTIRVVGGVVRKISNFDGLESRRGPLKRRPDIGFLSENKKTITFRFRTLGHVDGFDFQVSEEAQMVQFNLEVDGYGAPRRIFVGHKSQNPPKAAFELQAHGPQDK